MNPIIRFHSIVLAITTIIVFIIWDKISEIENNYLILKIILGSVSSIGFYRIFMIIIKYLILNIRCMKKWIFGSQYLEGVWVGYFFGKSGDVRFYIETFEQDFESILIRGRGYKEETGYFGSWISESVNFDERKGKLNYTYQSNSLSHSFINPGLAEFMAERKSLYSAPYAFIGYSSDLYHATKMKSYEIKISDEPFIDSNHKTLERAKQLYLETTGSILK